MAVAVAMRAAYIRLGFTATGADSLTDDQDIDSVQELQVLTDDEVKNLCKEFSHYHGMVTRLAHA